MGRPAPELTTYLKTGAIGIIVIGVFFFTKGQGAVRNFVEPSSGPFSLASARRVRGRPGRVPLGL